MKRILIFLAGTVLIAALLAAAVRFHRARQVSIGDNKVKVVVSVPLLRYLVQGIGGDEVRVECIIHGVACTHTYEPTMSDMAGIADCDLAVRVGLGFDSWFEKLTAAGPKSMAVVDASRGVRAIQDEEEEHHENEAKGHHHHELGNPHYFGDPDNVTLMAENICMGLCKVRPAKRRVFTANCARFVAELEEHARELGAEVAALSDKRVVSYSAAFPYFYAHFGFENLATVETACEQEVSPERLLEVTRLIQRKRVKVIVGERVYPTPLLESLAKDTGIKVVLLWPVSVESGDYLRTMRENVSKLVAALK